MSTIIGIPLLAIGVIGLALGLAYLIGKDLGDDGGDGGAGF